MPDNKGWIKIYRELLDKPIWQLSTKEQKVILITLLLMANHKPKKWEWNGEQFECAQGQFITSIAKIAEKSGNDISSQNVRTALKRFEKLNFLTNESTKTGRLITIVNWEAYQGYDDEANKGANKDLTKTSQRPNKDLTTNKNDKEDKNGKKENIYSDAFDSFWKVYPRRKVKPRAYKCYCARLKEGYTDEQLLKAAQQYAKECEETAREEKFIQLPSTFLSSNKPFEDYLGELDEEEQDIETGAYGRVIE